ncbi:MAG: NADP-dependent oxidoreductase [Minwuia sp.]|uniref:NADP-dependent oxidoreductase n=1 Tax=Minwuia sp. TaxID=2493630 RepID=UPI003A840781
MTNTTRQVIFAKRPRGWVSDDCFEIRDVAIPELADGDVLVRNIYMSVDPYMRGRMNDAKSYAAGFELGKVMQCGAIGEVVKSRNDKIPEGTVVTGMLNWETYTLVKGGDGLMPVDPKAAPLPYYISVLGMPGFTAWYGLLKIGEPKAGETVYVSAASGAVGQVVGQIAKIRGATVIGSAGSDDKCAYVTEKCGYDACFNYKTVDSYAKALHEHCPKGIDVYFENVGGKMLDAVLTVLNQHSRIALCGLISQYNLTEPEGIKYVQSLLINKVRLQGFIISDHYDLFPEFVNDVAGWLKSGQMTYRLSVAEGIDNAPGAFIGMLKGENFGKQVVKLGDDPYAA